MNSTDTTIDASKGQRVCWDSSWQDVIRFFFLNYGLHAFTILVIPGSSTSSSFSQRVISLLVPVIGSIYAIETIVYGTRRGRDDLHTALSAKALCMIVPAREMTGSAKYSIKCGWYVLVQCLHKR